MATSVASSIRFPSLPGRRPHANGVAGASRAALRGSAAPLPVSARTQKNMSSGRLFSRRLSQLRLIRPLRKAPASTEHVYIHGQIIFQLDAFVLFEAYTALLCFLPDSRHSASQVFF
jgi:hypothetical protein